MRSSAPLRLSAFALVFWSACAHAPVAELELASGRVETAQTAEAAIYAPEPLHRAETALATARTLSDEGGYLAALHAAGDAVTHADEAYGVATIERRVASRDVDRCLRELEGLIDIARSRGAPADEVESFRERYDAIRAVAEGGDLLTALDLGRQLKPEVLAFEQRFRR